MEDFPLPPQNTGSVEGPGPSRQKRTLLRCGCGCGCAIVLALVSIALVLLARHFLGTGPQVPTDHILGPDTVGFVHIEIGNDPKAEQLLASLVTSVASIKPGEVNPDHNPGVRDLIEAIQGLTEKESHEVNRFTIRALTLALEDVSGLESSKRLLTAEVVGAANLTAGVPLFRAFLERFSFGPTEYKEYTLLPLQPDAPEGPCLAFQHGTLLFSTKQQLMKRTLDQTGFVDIPLAPAASRLRPLFTELAPQYLVSAALNNGGRLPPGLLRVLIEPWAGELASLEDSAWLDLRFEIIKAGARLSGDALALRVDFLGLAPGTPELLESGLNEAVGLLAKELMSHGVELKHQILLGPDGLVLNLWWPDIEEWLSQAIRRSIVE